MVSQTDTTYLYMTNDTLKYQFDDGTVLNIYENGDSIVFESTDSIYISKQTGVSVVTGNTNEVAIISGGNITGDSDFTFLSDKLTVDTISSNAIYVDTLGIGTNTPSSKLTVIGDGLFTGHLLFG